MLHCSWRLCCCAHSCGEHASPHASALALHEDPKWCSIPVVAWHGHTPWLREEWFTPRSCLTLPVVLKEATLVFAPVRAAASCRPRWGTISGMPPEMRSSLLHHWNTTPLPPLLSPNRCVRVRVTISLHLQPVYTCVLQVRLSLVRLRR